MKLKLSVFTLVLASLVFGVWLFSTPLRAQTRDTGDDAMKVLSTESVEDAVTRKGSVSVIVGFKSDFTPEGFLTSTRRSKQRKQIGADRDAILAKLEVFKPEKVKQFEQIPYFAVTVDAATLEYLKSLPEVTSIRESRRLEPTLSVSTGVIGATTAWQAGFNGAGTTVAILDTGVDKTHPFLAGKVVSEGCYSTTSTAEGTVSICPGGVSSTTAADSGLNCTFTSSCLHGTHVAGISAGQLPTGAEQGVARGANVIAMQVFSRVTSNNTLNAFDADIIGALERVLALKQGGINVAAVNLSLGDGERYTSNCDAQYPEMKAAIDNLRSVGVATVFSSGNNGYTNGIGYPACISTAVSVGSTTDGNGGSAVDAVSSFSNGSALLDLYAPGQFIVSSVPGGSYSALSGTSMAAPHVAGAFAILRQKYPNASVTDLLKFLKASGQPVTDSRNGITTPRISVDKALCYAVINTNQTVSGSLTAADCSAAGAFYDPYAFSGTAGQRVSISMSSGFSSNLSLIGPNGQVVGQYNEAGSMNARIPAVSGYIVLPSTGIYSINATSGTSGAVGNYSLTVSAAPQVTVSGRVLTPEGAAIKNANVTLTDRTGASQRVVTNSFGAYQFTNLAVEETYQIKASSKRYRFSAANVLVNNTMTGVDFTGVE